MLKIFGSFCILSGGILARSLHLASRRRERDTLSDLLAAFRQMAETIRMARTPLPALLDLLASRCGPDVKAFFSGAAAAARAGDALPKIWGDLAEALPLGEADKAVVSSLGNSLQGDEETVCKAVSLAACQLAKSAEEAGRRRPDEEKRATALWLSAAALLVILLI